MSGNMMMLLGGSQAPAVDPYFYSVTSLLHGDGTNGGQNNTFLDSSTNNYTITRNGNTTQGSFSPFSQTGWSNYFQGSGNYLTIADGTQFNLSGAAYTIECWIYPNGNYGNYNTIVAKRAPSSSSTAWEIYLRTGSGVLSFYNGTNYESAITPPAFQWNHVAAVFDGTNINLYLNGVRVLQSAITNSNISASVFIGTYPSYDERYIGYISDLRITKGAALYTGTSFTVPTAKLTTTVSAGTVSLLTCQSNRFIDNSVNAAAITITGSPSTQPFTPFNPTTSYSSGNLGGSGYFDGSGDYLSGTSWASAGQFGTSDFTVEFWTYITGAPQSNQVIVSCNIYPNTTGIYIKYNGGAATDFIVASSSSAIVTSSAGWSFNAWHHIAVTRSGSTMTLWIDGVSRGTATFTNNLSDGLQYIGRPSDIANYMAQGYVSNLRIVKGTAVYTTTFTPPTSPVTAITNTSLLLNFTNGAIFDNAAAADYETVGNAQISTSVKKYGTGSMYFDGSGDGLSYPVRPVTDLGAGDLTVEWWSYQSSGLPYLSGDGVYSGEVYSGGTTGALGIFFYSASNTNAATNMWVYIYGVATLFQPAISISLNQWNFFALTRTAGVWRLFVNGTQVATSTTQGTYNLVNNSAIGYRPTANFYNYFPGYIDDFRVTKGVSRYPYNFTPPTAEFPNIGGTVTLTADPYYDYTTLLLPGNGTNGAQNNTFLDSSTNNFTITRNGNTTQGTFSPFSQTGWGLFNPNSTGGIGAATNAAFNMGTGDFTIEAWVNTAQLPTTNAWQLAAGGYQALFATGPSNSATGTQMYIGVTNLFFDISSDGSGPISVAHNMLPGQWYHVAVSRSGTTFRAFINGLLVQTATSSASWNNGYAIGIMRAEPIGAYNGNWWFGNVSNFRLVKGTAVYTASFTPSTTPLTAISGTSILTCQSNRFIDNSSNNFAITVSGSTSVQAFSPFNPTAAWSAATNGGSGYFDGSGDYLTVADNAAFTLGSGDFTIEMWIYTSYTGGLALDIAGQSSASGKLADTSFSIRRDGSAGLTSYVVSGGVVYSASSTTVIPVNQWNHIAFVRDGNTLRQYINGVQNGTVSVTGVTVADSVNPVGIGSMGAFASQPFNGYISGFRFIKGTCLYTGGTSFTPPTAPPTNITNTSLLCNFTNAGIYDATSKNDLETVGNAQISTTQSKFGGSSMYFDGTGDWLIGRSTDLASFGTGDFTIEGWLYPSAVTGADRCIWDTRAASGDAGMVVFIDTNGKISTYTSGAIRLTSTNALAANTWQHFALCRYNGTLAVFINGLRNGTLAYSTAITCPGRISVAVRFDNAAPYTGYIDDLRITKGIARYTANFTPPSAAFLTL